MIENKLRESATDKGLEQQISKVKVFTSPDYANYVVQYYGKYEPNLEVPPYVYITPIDKKYAIVSIKLDSIESPFNINNIREVFRSYVDREKFGIIYINPPELYSLSQISAVEAIDLAPLQENLSLDLTGGGVVFGIIDTGIDYLNEEFQDENGDTRINIIWDQTIENNSGEYSVIFGSVYDKQKINDAIKAHKAGEDPYKIVPSKDENGHGTHMAGIVAASGKNPAIKSIAPKCELAVVKLTEAIGYKELAGFNKDINAYAPTSIFAALSFLTQYAIKVQKPIVILLPLGTTSGNHKGYHIMDSYIGYLTNNVGIIVVTSTGNEGISDGHVSGIIIDETSNEDIELLVAEKRNKFYIGIWVDLPNIANIDIISPSGQATGTIQAVFNQSGNYRFILEGTKVEVYYDLPEKYSGDEYIRLYFTDITPGLWRIRLSLQRGISATYNVWMWQKEFVGAGTRFTPSDPYGTITIPADSDNTVSVAGFNQNNANLLPYSGVSLLTDYIGKIDFAAGAVSTPTTGLNNTVAVINGTSLSAAVGAGICVLLLQWGIVNRNYPFMYTQSIKTFLRRGTAKRPGDVYPNPNIGYGIIEIYRVFANMT